jgi:uncharacterized protein involved in tolerance to divalent cations
MVNVVIYIDDRLDPKLIISSLFEKKLIAKATIDFNNKVFLISEGKLKENNNSVITCQTRSLLFTDIVKFVEENFGKKIKICSLPIISSNKVFEEEIINSTLKV